jgi:hypothetical protein
VQTVLQRLEGGGQQHAAKDAQENEVRRGINIIIITAATRSAI